MSSVSYYFCTISSLYDRHLRTWKIMTSKILTGFNPLGTLRSSHSCSNISLFSFLLCYFIFFPSLFLSGTDSTGWTILTTHFTPKWSMTWTAKTRNGERDTIAIRCASHFWNSFEILRFLSHWNILFLHKPLSPLPTKSLRTS